MGDMLPIHYHNDKIYIDNELFAMDTYILYLQNDIAKLHANSYYDSHFKYITFIRNKTKDQIRRYVEEIHEFNSDPIDKLHNEDYDECVFLLNFIMAAENVKIQNNDRPTKYICAFCNRIFNRWGSADGHIRNDDYCCIYYKLDVLTPKHGPNANFDTIWESRRDLQNTPKYRRRLNVEETLLLYI